MKRMLMLSVVLGLLFTVTAPPPAQAQNGIAPLIFKLAANKTFTSNTIDTSVSILIGGNYITNVAIMKDTCVLYRWVDYSVDRGTHWSNVAADTVSYASGAGAADTTVELALRNPTTTKFGGTYGYARTRYQWKNGNQATVTASRKYWNYMVQTK